MVPTREYVENEEGVHLLMPDNCTIYTMCGIEYEAAENAGFKKTIAQVVTCSACCEVIIHCRGVLIDTTGKPAKQHKRKKRK